MKLNIDKIEEQRKALRFSKEKLCAEIGLTRQGLIYIYHSKKAAVDTMEKISNVLRISPGELLV